MRSMLIAAGALVATPAAAHVVFDRGAAEPGAYYAGFLRVSHGCGPSPTVSLRVEIPEGVLSAKPQPKPGWALEIERAPLAEPVTGENGARVTERVVAVTWTGRLPVDQFDQFGLMLKLPDRAGPLYFPTRQTCEQGAMEWTGIPPSPEQWHDLPQPAPMLVLRAADAMNHHAH